MARSPAPSSGLAQCLLSGSGPGNSSASRFRFNSSRPGAVPGGASSRVLHRQKVGGNPEKMMIWGQLAGAAMARPSDKKVGNQGPFVVVMEYFIRLERTHQSGNEDVWPNGVNRPGRRSAIPIHPSVTPEFWIRTGLGGSTAFSTHDKPRSAPCETPQTRRSHQTPAAAPVPPPPALGCTTLSLGSHR